MPFLEQHPDDEHGVSLEVLVGALGFLLVLGWMIFQWVAGLE